MEGRMGRWRGRWVDGGEDGEMEGRMGRWRGGWGDGGEDGEMEGRMGENGLAGEWKVNFGRG